MSSCFSACEDANLKTFPLISGATVPSRWWQCMGRTSVLRRTSVLKPPRWSVVPSHGQHSAFSGLPVGVEAAWYWHAWNFIHGAQHLPSQARVSRYILAGLNSTIMHQSKQYLIWQWGALSLSHENGTGPTTTIALYLRPFQHSLHGLPTMEANRRSQKAAASSERSDSSPVQTLWGNACSKSLIDNLSYSMSFLVLNSWEDTTSFMQWSTKQLLQLSVG